MTSVFTSPLQTPPRVPPEVWLRIFCLAADLEDLLNCDNLLYPDFPRMLVKQYELQRLKDSLRTKRSVALVCRTWNELALEILYQSILITRVDTLASLHETLQRHTLIAQGKNRLGWWTKRLDVLIDDERCESSDYTMLAALVRQLPNLSIVTLSMPMLPFNDCWLRQLPTSFMVSLTEACEDLMMLLAASPNLRVLRCPICSPTPADRASRSRLDVPVMSKLESITLMSVFLRDYLPRDKDANHLPALRQLTYDCIPPPFFDHPWKNFVKLTCANLTSVTLDLSLPGESLQNEFDLLSECCAVLDKLVIYLRSWLEFRPCLVLPPVSFLGLHSNAPKGLLFHHQALVSALVTLTAPKLRTVRLLHANAAEQIRENASSFAAEDRTYLASCHFSLEDLKGRVLLP
ncbi:hypothetical protein JVT61DRAFT_14522 [Boletus reticuloceps]|uniref:F-box domain-containing protein n=1 Tax=Boletus reticuloceps TaxID=495285 RepID=A0A8I2YRJ8_9AGAM|nr:hypothetical protein JVT61DRAFT_14522 [Boletus reticuloceps]